MPKNKVPNSIRWTPELAKEMTKAYSQRLIGILKDYHVSGRMAKADESVVRHDPKNTQLVRAQICTDRINRQIVLALKEITEVLPESYGVECELAIAAALLDKAVEMLHHIADSEDAVCKILNEVSQASNPNNLEFRDTLEIIHSNIDAATMVNIRQMPTPFDPYSRTDDS